MEQWLDTKERSVTVATRVTPSEKQTIERLRKTLRARSKGEVLRFGLQLVESALSLANVEVPGEDEQVRVLRKLAETIQSKDDAYLKSDEAADDFEEFVRDITGVDPPRLPRIPLVGEEDSRGKDGGLFEETQ